MTPAELFIARLNAGELKKAPANNLGNPFSRPCMIDFAKLERERDEQLKELVRTPLPPRIW